MEQLICKTAKGKRLMSQRSHPGNARRMVMSTYIQINTAIALKTIFIQDDNRHSMTNKWFR
ncbi:MAG: hypothetical protein EBU92_04070 [Betaproteobacteria bacterium]|nr:hypothetical protein [Betaproteobacteria bacterium]